MTALAIHASHAPQHVWQLSWPRIGAWSGTLSLHLVILALLLVPPVALQVARHVDTDEIVTIINPPVVKPEPPMPITPVKQKTPPPVKHDTPPPIVQTAKSDMAVPVPEIPAPPTNDVAIQTVPADSEPSAIGYKDRTRVAYPRESLRDHEQGTVMLRVLVGADGIPKTVEIEKSSGFRRLDFAARDAVKNWTFHPAIRNGVASSAWALVPITFNLSLL